MWWTQSKHLATVIWSTAANQVAWQNAEWRVGAHHAKLNRQCWRLHTPPTSPGTTFDHVTGGRIWSTFCECTADGYTPTQSAAAASEAAIKRLRGHALSCCGGWWQARCGCGASEDTINWWTSRRNIWLTNFSRASCRLRRLTDQPRIKIRLVRDFSTVRYVSITLL